jgi:endoglucanase
MDEIGFLVNHIDKKTGFLRIHPVGGFDPVVLFAERVAVHTESGSLLGTIGRRATHALSAEDRKKMPELRDLFVDLGLPAERVQELVSVGDTVTMQQSFAEVGDLISCKALDDRVGVYVGIEAMKRVRRPDCDLYFVATTQEEVGLRGAIAAGYALQPTIGVALDVTLATDIPDVSERDRITALGEGVAIKLKDSRSISHPALVRGMRRLAEENDIPYQYEILPRGGTDAGALQQARDGAAVITLSIPTRYVHSVVETAHPSDIEATIALLVAFLESASAVDLAT